MHRRLFRISSSLVALVAFCTPMTAFALTGGPTLSLQSSASSVSTNGQFTVSLLIDTKSFTVTAAELKVSFPSDKLQALSITKGTFLPSELIAGSVGTGNASITLASDASGKTGTGTVATITFKALTAGVATIEYSASTQIAAIGQSSNVVDTMSPTSVTISGASVATPTPTATMTATPTTSTVSCTAQYDPVCGVNGVTYMNRCSAEQQYRIAVAYPGACTTATPTSSPRTTPIGTVSTGPGDITITALILSALTTLLYVGYTRTSAFRKHEIEEIADQERQTPPDFRS